MSISRGKVWLVDLGYAGKIRPALVISIEPWDTDRALVTLISHTTSRRGTRFEVTLPVVFLKPGAFDAQNPVTAPLAKLIRRLGVLTTDELAQVEDAVRTWLDL